jgi:hypothetical protein
VQDAPRIEPNYLTHPQDVAQALRGARLTQRIAQTAAMRGPDRLARSPRT